MSLENLSPDEFKRLFVEAMRESGRSTNIDTKDLEKYALSIRRSFESLDKDIKRNKATMGGFVNDMMSGRRHIRDLTHEIEYLDRQLEELADDVSIDALELKKEIQARKQAIAIQHRENEVRRATVEGLINFSKTLTGVAGRTMGAMIKGLQDNTSAFSVAGGVMEGVIEGANAGVQTLGAGAQTIGSAMMMGSGKAKIMGGALALAGIAAQKFGDAAAQASKFIVQYMVKQLEMTVDSFNKISGTGVLFANGMTGMYDAADLAGLTITQFSEVMQSSSDRLAGSGLGMTEAALQMGRTGKVMRDTGITANLLKLGYGFKEQAELTAEVMADMRTANSTILKDPAGIAKATESYATNLRVIASITGQDAKKKLEEARQAAANVAFRAKIMELEKQHPGIYRKTLDVMATMTSVQKQNYVETVLFGTAINKTGAIIEAQSESLRNYTQETARATLDGTLDVTQNQKRQGEALEEFRDRMGDLTAIGLAGAAGKLTEVNTALSEFVLASDRVSKKSVEDAQNNATQQKTANDKLTMETTAAAVAMQDAAVRLQNLVKNELAQAAYYSGLVVTEISDQLNNLRNIREGKTSTTAPTSRARTMAGYAGTALGALGGAVAGLPAGPMGVIGGAATGGMLGKELAEAAYDKFGTAGKTPEGFINDYSSLSPFLKDQKETIGGGAASPKIIEALQRITQAHPQTVITAINDEWHQKNRPFSAHTRGLAADIRVPPGQDPKKFTEEVNRLISGLAKGNYEGPGEGTGPHVHLKAMAKGGITDGLSIAGEEGPEAVVPLPDGRRIPVIMDNSEMLSKMQEMIVVMREHKATSDKILKVAS